MALLNHNVPKKKTYSAGKYILEVNSQFFVVFLGYSPHIYEIVH